MTKKCWTYSIIFGLKRREKICQGGKRRAQFWVLPSTSPWQIQPDASKLNSKERITHLLALAVLQVQLINNVPWVAMLVNCRKQNKSWGILLSIARLFMFCLNNCTQKTSPVYEKNIYQQKKNCENYDLKFLSEFVFWKPENKIIRGQKKHQAPDSET